MKCSSKCSFSAFAVNPETSSSPHGPPRGLINRFISIGLPPWAAWCHKSSRYAMYRMSNIAPATMLPKHPSQMEAIWMNETIRQRVRTSRKVQNVYRQLKYPYTRPGVYHSDILDHWVQIPMVEAATFAIEQDGGLDNFILKRPGFELRSQYGERIRRHILVRQKEIQKNFVLEKHAKHLAKLIQGDVREAKTSQELHAVLEKYGVDKKELFTEMARGIRAARNHASRTTTSDNSTRASPVDRSVNGKASAEAEE